MINEASTCIHHSNTLGLSVSKGSGPEGKQSHAVSVVLRKLQLFRPVISYTRPVERFRILRGVDISFMLGLVHNRVHFKTP